jgi:serine/threonine-protein kinase
MLLCAWGVVACSSSGTDASPESGGGSGNGGTAIGNGGNGTGSALAGSGGARGGQGGVSGGKGGAVNSNAGTSSGKGGAPSGGGGALSGNGGAPGGSGGSGGSVGNGGSGGASTGGCTCAGGTGTGGSTGTDQTRLTPSAIFYQDISQAKVDPESKMLLDALQTRTWGDAGKRQTIGIDFSFEINVANSSTPRRSFTQDPGALPDCDTAPVPLVPGGKTEGSDNYACADGDCHLIVYQGTRLYELYQSNVTSGVATGGTFTGSCLVVWDLTRDYWKPENPPDFSRGDGCNGADAGDMPIAPLVLTAEELKARNVKHALRFTISNNRIRSGVYVHPATHIGGPSGGADTLPYGARLRLRADYDLASLPNDAARAVAKALQTYGMFLADGGNIYVSATTAASAEIGNSAIAALAPKDFEMIDGGPRIDWHQQNCTRTPVAD